MITKVFKGKTWEELKQVIEEGIIELGTPVKEIKMLPVIYVIMRKSSDSDLEPCYIYEELKEGRVTKFKGIQVVTSFDVPKNTITFS